MYGAMRIRTADPLNAIEVLYQLSYNPALLCIIYYILEIYYLSILLIEDWLFANC